MGLSPGPQDPRNPRDTQDPFQPPGRLETFKTPLDPENLPGTTGILRDVMRKKDFSGIIISFIFKKLQFFNYKKFSILNRLFLRNDLLEIFNFLLK